MSLSSNLMYLSSSKSCKGIFNYLNTCNMFSGEIFPSLLMSACSNFCFNKVCRFFFIIKELIFFAISFLKSIVSHFSPVKFYNNTSKSTVLVSCVFNCSNKFLTCSLLKDVSIFYIDSLN